MLLTLKSAMYCLVGVLLLTIGCLLHDVSADACEDKANDCAARLLKFYDFCFIEDPDCRFTCGRCPGSDGIIASCQNPGPGANATLDGSFSSMISIQRGDYIEYKCFKGYVHESGSLRRPCVDQNTLLGSAPVCKLPADAVCKDEASDCEARVNGPGSWEYCEYAYPYRSVADCQLSCDRCSASPA